MRYGGWMAWLSVIRPGGLQTGLSDRPWVWCCLTVGLVLLSLWDMRKRVIPDGILLFLAIVRLGLWGLDGFSGKILWEFLLGTFSVSIPLLVLILFLDSFLKKQTLGGGDLKLTAVLGLYFSWERMLYVLFFAALAGLICCLPARWKKWKSIPFGPCLAVGAFLTAWIRL